VPLPYCCLTPEGLAGTPRLTCTRGGDDVLHSACSVVGVVAVTATAITTCCALKRTVCTETSIACVGTCSSALIHLIDFSCWHNP